ncbi:MAG TPA: hypothetical protein VHU91_08625, partial [Mycobacteriales bacterium]|nr:hypothetical protein [Mycobacteriales bacterium]
MIGARRVNMGLLASLCVLLTALLCALAPAIASAAIAHEPESFSPLDGSGSGVTIHDPSGVAIDEATGNVFVTDGSGGEAVLELGGTGGAPVGLASPFSLTGLSFGSSAAGIAFDNASSSAAKGTLYLFQEEKIDKYVRSAVTERYEVAGEIPALGTGSPAGLAVDGQGDIYLGGFSSQSVLEWSPAGTLMHTYNLAATPTNRPSGLAVDSAGDLFVQRQGGGGVYEYPAGASGEVEVSNPIPVTTESASGVSYDPSSNHLYVALGDRVVEYDATTLAVIDEFGEEVLEATERIAVNSATGRVYVADKAAGRRDVAVFGGPVNVPTIGVGAATNITGTKATLNGSVNPEGIEIEDCFFEWGVTTSYGHTAPCQALPPTDSEAHAVSAEIAGLTANGATYHFRLIATNKNGKEKTHDRSFETAATVATEAATGVGAAAATLNGAVRPEGLQYTSCVFEYGLTSGAGFEKEAACDPLASELPADFSPHAVSTALTGAQPNSTYKFRLTATNANGTLSGETLTFTTQGPPLITEIRALEAEQGSGTLEAKIDPSGSGTSYRFEWGTTTSYGHSVPAEFEPYIGEGEKPVLVTAKLSGLSAGTTYHYRVVARNKAGTTASPDQILETLDSCGLPEQRCFELVSPREAGPVALPGETPTAAELHFQAAAQLGSLAYVVESGLSGATKGAEVLYQGIRGSGGWASSQLSAPIVAPNETLGTA